MDNLQQKIGEWGDMTFPRSTLYSLLAHLAEEVAELTRATSFAELSEELADVQHLLFHLAHRHGISLHDATVEKFEKNQQRIWAQTDRGYAKHVE